MVAFFSAKAISERRREILPAPRPSSKASLTPGSFRKVSNVATATLKNAAASMTVA